MLRFRVAVGDTADLPCAELLRRVAGIVRGIVEAMRLNYQGLSFTYRSRVEAVKREFDVDLRRAGHEATDAQVWAGRMVAINEGGWMGPLGPRLQRIEFERPQDRFVVAVVYRKYTYVDWGDCFVGFRVRCPDGTELVSSILKYQFNFVGQHARSSFLYAPIFEGEHPAYETLMRALLMTSA